MKIKKYIAANIQEGKNRVIDELGEDAIILSTRTIVNPESSESAVEIVAALDTNAQRSDEYSSAKPEAITAKTIDKLPDTDSDDIVQRQLNKLFTEINQVQNQLFELTEIVRFKNISALSPNARNLYKILLDNGLSENMVLNTIIRLNINDGSINLYDSIKDAGKLILERIKFGDVIERKGEKQIIGFVGSTGSGKTSVLIKLAIICKLVFEGRVLIISADNIKIGGADQLQSYASIAGIQFRAVNSNEELLATIKNESEYDYIFIDSAGAGYHNISAIDDVNKIIENVDFTHKYLVMQANLSKNSIKNTINTFKKWKPTSIILSKIDETIRYGEVVEGISTATIPLSYFSIGQNIPDDIEQAEKRKLLELLLPELQRKEEDERSE